jgi:hypothetical protein
MELLDLLEAYLTIKLIDSFAEWYQFSKTNYRLKLSIQVISMVDLNS